MFENGKRQNLVVVLVEPRRQGNVGAVARAMKNCGLSDLRIVRGARIGKEARRMAVHAADLLERAKRFPDLASALADAVAVFGFSPKRHRFRGEPIALPEAAAKIRRCASRGKVALVFGREDEGLRGEEIRLCGDLVRIPSSSEYPVFNLAQSVLLAAYVTALVPRRSSGRVARVGRLARAQKQALLEKFCGLLLRLAYGEPSRNNRSARILARLADQFDRALLETADLQLWMGLMRRLEQRLRGHP